jgi:multidrug efflux pump subunit AcrB
MKQPKHELSYLERITFNPKLLIGWVASWIGNVRIVILLVISILFLGIFSYNNIPRRLNPEINIPIVSVITALPGAGAEDVESLVTIPLESELQNVKDLDTISSVSSDNVSVITMQFSSKVQTEKAKQDVQTLVDGVSGLPSDAVTPKVKGLDFEDRPIWTFAVSSDTELPSLMRFSETLKKKLENTPTVDRVVVAGFETQEIAVTINPEKTKQLGINPLTLSSLIKTSINAYPAGLVETSTNTFSLTIDPQAMSVSDIRSLKLTVSGNIISLGDIATIVERTKPNLTSSYLVRPNTKAKQVVTFHVYKATNTNFDRADVIIKKAVNDTVAEYNGTFKIDTISDYAKQISDQFTELLGEFTSTIILVMACLFLFLGVRQALISSLTVPLTFLSAFAVINAMGMTINFLTLFAFLIALGLLVDDTIVTVQAMTQYYKTGKFTPYQTGLVVWKDLIVPIWSTTITTIWSFVPLLLATGIIGEFIKPIPIVVTVTMISSTAIAVLITLPFMIVLLKPAIPHRVILLGKILALALGLWLLFVLTRGNPFFVAIALVYILLTFVFTKVIPSFSKRMHSFIESTPTLTQISGKLVYWFDHGVISIEPASRAYYRLIRRIIASKSARKKVVIAIVLYAIISFSLLPLGFIKNEFFPKTNVELIYVSLELPPGTSLSVTKQESLAVLEQLKNTPEAIITVADTGSSLSTMGAQTDKNNSTLFTIHLTPKDKRTLTSMAISEKLREQFKTMKTIGKVSVTELSSGPPAGSDLQIKLSGDDLSALDSYAKQIMDYLSGQAGVTNIEKSIKSGTSKIVFVPDTAKITQAGLTPDAVGLWMRTFASGFTLANVKFDKTDRTKTDVVFSFGDGLESPQSVGTLSIPTAQGSVPLLSLGTLVARPNPVTITREAGKRTISVTAGVKSGYNGSELGKKLEAYADSLKLKDGYSWKTGGMNEENRKSVTSILQAMAVAFILILVTMVVQFKSYRQALLVLLVIPFAVSSVFLIFALTGIALSFPALIGVLSLFGIVVTNSMFIVDKININLRQDMPFEEAIADAGASRLEPIILTKLCTVFGLLPITLSNALWQGL